MLVVIHEISGLTDWIRAVTDQLAANSYIAIAPDLLSGKGPEGGGTDRSTATEQRPWYGRWNGMKWYLA